MHRIRLLAAQISTPIYPIQTSTGCRTFQTGLNIIRTPMANSSLSPPQAPWRSRFEFHLDKLPMPEFSLSTVFLDEQGEAHPRVRTCMFRGFWAELAARGPSQESLSLEERNPAIYESDMLTLTTDVRMRKAGQIQSSGGPVECLFWVPAISTQWRLKGRAFVVGASDDDETEKLNRAEIWKQMRRRSGDETHSAGLTDGKANSWRWEKEITTHFANMSPIMRGKSESISLSSNNGLFHIPHSSDLYVNLC